MLEARQEALLLKSRALTILHGPEECRAEFSTLSTALPYTAYYVNRKPPNIPLARDPPPKPFIQCSLRVGANISNACSNLLM